MAPANIFITGCNRGIGLELVKEYLKQKPANLFATCRDPSKADDLNALAKENPNLHVLKLEITDHSAYQGVVDKVQCFHFDDRLHGLYLVFVSPHINMFWEGIRTQRSHQYESPEAYLR